MLLYQKSQYTEYNQNFRNNGNCVSVVDLGNGCEASFRMKIRNVVLFLYQM